jgi:hypothetical protein
VPTRRWRPQASRFSFHAARRRELRRSQPARDRNAWGEADYRGIVSGVDDMVAKGIADPDRLGVMGASYGGGTDGSSRKPTAVRAASAGASIGFRDRYFLSEGGEFMAEYFSAVVNRESYAAHRR